MQNLSCKHRPISSLQRSYITVISSTVICFSAIQCDYKSLRKLIHAFSINVSLNSIYLGVAQYLEGISASFCAIKLHPTSTFTGTNVLLSVFPWTLLTGCNLFITQFMGGLCHPI